MDEFIMATEQTNSHLLTLVAQLDHRLAGVLRPLPPKEQIPIPDVNGPSLIQRLDMERRRVNGACNILADMLERLEL